MPPSKLTSAMSTIDQESHHQNPLSFSLASFSAFSLGENKTITQELEKFMLHHEIVVPTIVAIFGSNPDMPNTAAAGLVSAVMHRYTLPKRLYESFTP